MAVKAIADQIYYSLFVYNCTSANVSDYV